MGYKDTWKELNMYSGVLAGIIFVIGTIIAMLTYPNYSITGNFFSDTGLRVDSHSIIDGHLVKAHPYPYIFSVTLYLTALFLLPYYISIPLIMNSEDNTSKTSRILYWVCFLLGMIIVPATIAVGYFDWGYHANEHIFAAQTTLSGILLFVLTWTLADFFLNEDHPYKSKSKMETDIAVSVFIILCSYTQIGLPVPTIMIQYITLQIYQKAAIYSALIYLAVIARRLIAMMKLSNSAD